MAQSAGVAREPGDNGPLTAPSYQPPANSGERFGVTFQFDPNGQATLVLPVRS
ncbi:hypothetical protein [Burkholderia oklahomensis]|uniref:Uncharacterized protein n=1 Tax=Burkholderia oklahomensis TaxID=342113 RepID=A0AAI8BAG1_9BURK|nr:hypothetical protein [Burkholderia oklahomensis]AIO68692.1 hypothetical protein DM82_5331 [Burkholderia oklahomensis]AJX33877.1 hypothetical protein BG90_5278 [Burkholderia oklahomensis C6786]MBI0362844.1 hypothetical protein [Burkholderia oklahomensis]QPS40397.1 hypothetical protein I6G57_32140 [Burkholderia oklahomensis]SUY26952.1 Uncharacterised protein [Burkholderia oklahomensis]